MRTVLPFFTLAFVFLSSLGFARIKNLGHPMEGVYRGAWLHNGERDFKELKRKGVDTIINLELYPDDAELCSRFEMNCVHTPVLLLPWVEMFQKTNDSILEAFWTIKKLLKEKHKVYIHCLRGSDRTGLLVAALEMSTIKGKNWGSISKTKLNDIFEELHFHKYSRIFFPGIKRKISNWASNSPSWFLENPFR